MFGLDNISKRFNEASHDTSNHFVEGLQYSLNEAVIMTAVMVADYEVDYRNVNVLSYSFIFAVAMSTYFSPVFFSTD